MKATTLLGFFFAGIVLYYVFSKPSDTGFLWNSLFSGVQNNLLALQGRTGTPGGGLNVGGLHP